MLVDDHALLREGMRSLLERESSISVVGEANTVAEALDSASRCSPDVMVVDLKLTAGADYEGLRLISELSKRYPSVAALVLTTFLDDELVVRAVRSGAKGYVVKDIDTTELVRAIKSVSRGDSAFDPRSAAVVLRAVTGQGQFGNADRSGTAGAGN